MASPLTLTELRRLFRDPPPDARPMMRWWWFGPDVSRTDIERDLTTMAQVGIGGVEVAYVYPLVEHPTRLGSEQFLADLAYAADIAERLGLRFDVTLGSGWSFGGPHIGPEHAAQRLRWDRREIGPAAATLAGGQQVWPADRLVGAWLGAGSGQEPPETWQPVPVETDGSVRIPTGDGTRVVLTATAGLTGQNVKRAAAGAEGPVHDHYCAAAVRTHLAALGDKLIDAVGADRIGTVFCDSLEVYGSDWTPRLPEEFATRRGYRLEPELHLLVTDSPDAGRFRADYYRTLSELFEDEFLLPLAEWAHARGVKLRVQSYGEPPMTLSSYRHVDAIEGEQWGWTGNPPTKWASSAAHLLAVPIVSSETWTWVHAPSFRATPLDLKGEAHEHFLAGVNQLIGHGWPCTSRPDGSDPRQGVGHVFYASGAFDDRNAWWPAAPDLMRYLTRLSALLRQGEPVRDVLVYLPTTDAYARLGAHTTLDLFTTVTGLIDPAITASVRRAGYDYVLYDDDATGYTEPTADLTVLLPGEVSIPASTRDWLDAVEAAGGRVLTVRADEDAAALLGRSVAPDLGLEPPQTDLGTVHRRVAGVDVYLLVNTGPHVKRTRALPRARHRVVEVWDPASGNVVDTDPAEITLLPYQAVILVAHDEDPAQPATVDRPGSPRSLTAWQLVMPDGSRQPVTVPHRWEDDARIGPDFSGTLAYETELGRGGRLDLGPGAARTAGSELRSGIEGRSYRVAYDPPVGEVVRVLVDDEPVATLWAPPYRCELPAGRTLRLEVSNTTANALAADPTIERWVADAERWHGRRFRMQALDRVRDGLTSGLLTVPKIASD